MKYNEKIDNDVDDDGDYADGIYRPLLLLLIIYPL